MRFQWSSLLARFGAAKIAMLTPPPQPSQSTESHPSGPIKLLQVESALERYLQFYVRVEEPEYAVLITGPWGAGKTYQVLRCLPPDRIYYVSLYGIDSVEQLHAEILAAAAPSLGKIQDSASAIGDVMGETMGIGQLGKLVPKVLNSFLRRKLRNDRVLVFDDLERSNIELNDLLGAINVYVEHKKFRVVVIAYDEQMLEEFAAVKEKMFGQSLRVETQLVPAFRMFLSRISDIGAREFVRNHEEGILNTFAESEIGSLRILRHVVEDLARFYPALTDKHFNKPTALASLVELFAALNVEVRAGRLSEVDLRDRYRAQVGEHFRQRDRSGGADRAPAPLVVAAARYSRFNLSDTCLSDDVLVAMLVHGSYELGQIRKSLDASPGFTDPANLRPWQVVMNFDGLDDDVVGAAVERMEEEFFNRTVVDPGELLHIFSLRMLIAYESGSPQAIQKAEDEAIQYIDDLAAHARLLPMEPDADLRFGNEAYGGYAYWVKDPFRPNFERISCHLAEARIEVMVSSYPAFAETLMNTLRTDPDHAIVMIRAEGETLRGPFLQYVDPVRFAATWVELSPSWWRLLTIALDARYANGRLEREFAAEKDWLARLHAELLAQAGSRSGLAALRIRRAVPKVMSELAK